jgi:hypothetical protein
MPVSREKRVADIGETTKGLLLRIFTLLPYSHIRSVLVTLFLVPSHEQDCCKKTIITAEEVASQDTLVNHSLLDSKTWIRLLPSVGTGMQRAASQIVLIPPSSLVQCLVPVRVVPTSERAYQY